MDSVYSVTEWVMRILLPPTCLCCGQPGVAGLDLCAGCYRDLPWNRHACRQCGQPVAPGQSHCGHCQGHTPAYDAAVVPWIYEPPVDGLIQALKFNGDLAAGRLLGALLGRELVRRHTPVDAIVPMPLHPRRLRERGFNQAAEIARTVSRIRATPMRHGWLLRQRHTNPQTGLDRARREQNIHRAFDSRGPVHGKRIALVDDVITTGNTTDEAAKALKRQGAAEVVIWAVARAALQL